MAGLRVTVSAVGQPFRTAGGWQAPRQPARDDQDALLAEAIRFHELDEAPVRKPPTFKLFKQWGGIHAFELGVEKLRRDLHDAARAFLTTLAGPLHPQGVRSGANLRVELSDDSMRKLREETLPRERAARVTQEGVPMADAGRAAVRLLVSPQWRKPERAQLLATRPRPQPVRFRRLEDLHKGLSDLRAIAARGAVEAALRASFGDDIVDVWGGSRAVLRDERPDRPVADDSPPDGGYRDLGQSATGLAEKLHQEFATSPFQLAHGRARVPASGTLAANPVSVPGGTDFRLHLDVRRQVDVLANEVLPIATPPEPFASWLTNLDTLEECFLAALRPPNAVLAAEVGLPWALALTATLRAYLYELIGRTMMLALPIEQMHRNDDGYVAVALWEALAGRPAPHPVMPGYLAPPGDEDGLLPALSDWRSSWSGPDSFLDAWPSVVHHSNLVKRLAKLAPRPCLIPGAPTDGKSKPRDTDASLDEQAARWSAYVPAHLSTLRHADVGLELRVGASLIAQCHLYAAGWILATAVQKFGVPASAGGEEGTTGAAAPLHKAPKDPPPFAPALRLGDGSYLWNGGIPQHLEHRDGATFDLVHGPSCVPWLRLDVSKEVRDSLDALIGAKWKEAGRTVLGIFTEPAKRQSREAEAHVFAGAVGALVDDQLAAARKALSDEDIRGAVRKVEARLAGLPHLRTALGAQQVQAGHLALLLSGPTQVLHASPVVHLRAIEAIAAGLGREPREQRGLALSVATAVSFVVRPQDHHDHWHVRYGPLADPPAPPDTPQVLRLLPLWAALGVNLAPLAEHLRALPIVENDWPELVRQRATLLTAFDEYIPDTAGLDRLFKVYSYLSRSDLVEPVGRAKPSKELTGAIRDTESALAVARGRPPRWTQFLDPPEFD